MVIMKLIFVTGLPGIDRKSIINLALQRAGRKSEFSLVDFDTIEDITEDIGEIPDMATAKELIARFSEKMQKTLIGEIKKQKGSIAVNGHLTFATKYGYEHALSDEFFRSFRPDVIVLIEKQKLKKKPNGDVVDVLDPQSAEHQTINRHFAAVYSSISGSAIKIIKLSEEKTMDAVSALTEIIKS